MSTDYSLNLYAAYDFMFTTNSVALCNDHSHDSNSDNVNYRCGDITAHMPFLIATFSTIEDSGLLEIRSRLMADFEVISNTLFNNPQITLDKMQLMKPKNNLLGGWKLHDILLIRTVTYTEGRFDEYITTEGNVLTFIQGTLNELSHSINSIHVHYKMCEKVIRFQSSE